MTIEFRGEQILADLQHDPDYLAGEFCLNITDFVHQLLEETGTTQAELANRLDVSPGYVSRFLSAPPNMQIRTIFRISSALEIAPKVLFDSGLNLVFASAGGSFEDAVIDAVDNDAGIRPIHGARRSIDATSTYDGLVYAAD